MPTDADARQILIDARKTFLNDLFSDCELKLKTTTMLGVLGWMTKDIASIKSNMSSMGGRPSSTTSSPTAR